MADLTLTASVGPNSASASLTPTDTRFIEFLDDLRNLHYPPKEDGSPLTRVEVAQKWMDDLMSGQVAFAKGLKQRRLANEVAEADDLAGN